MFADLADIELYIFGKIREILKKITIFLALCAILHSFCVSSTLTLKSVDTASPIEEATIYISLFNEMKWF